MKDAGQKGGLAAFGDELNRTLGACDASKSNAGELGNRLMPSTKIIQAERRQLVMPTGSGHDLHQMRRCLKKLRQLLSALVDI